MNISSIPLHENLLIFRTFPSWKMFQMVINFYGGRIIEFLFIRMRHFLYELLKAIQLLYVHRIISETKNIRHPSNIFESKLPSIIVVPSEKNIICIVKRILCNNSLCYINLYYWLEKNTNSFSFAKNEKEKKHIQSAKYSRKLNFLI